MFTKMELYMLEESWEILQTDESVFYSNSTKIETLKLKIEVMVDKLTQVRTRCVRSAEHIPQNRSVRKQQSISIWCHSQQLNISCIALMRVLQKDLAMRPHEVQLVQQLKHIDHLNRLKLSSSSEYRFAEDDEFFRKLMYSNETHFHLGGCVSKQNCPTWNS